MASLVASQMASLLAVLHFAGNKLATMAFA